MPLEAADRPPLICFQPEGLPEGSRRSPWGSGRRPPGNGAAEVLHPGGVPDTRVAEWADLTRNRGVVVLLRLWHPAGVLDRIRNRLPVVVAPWPQRPPATFCQPSGLCPIASFQRQLYLEPRAASDKTD